MIDGLRPRPSLTFPQPVSPFSANAVRQARTVTAVTAYRAAITEFASPSAASNRTLARVTSRYGAETDPATRSSTSRSVAVIDNGAAGALMPDHIANCIPICETHHSS